MSKVKRILVTIMASLGLFAPAVMPVAVYAEEATGPNINEGLCDGANLQISDSNDCTTSNTQAAGTVNNIIEDVINIFSLVVGVVSVIMIIVGGLKYITSGGDSGNVTGAKNTILYAVIGLVVVALAQVIVKFVLNQTTDATIPDEEAGGFIQLAMSLLS